jgi:L,D-peptidoglycan transpeptidase YkuD (ErfK/YbiS/YcfS/YnhG family)
MLAKEQGGWLVWPVARNGNGGRHPPVALPIRAVGRRSTSGFIDMGGWRLACALGRTGAKVLKREGDGATPVGVWRLIGVLFRPDRGPRPVTGLPVRPLRPDDGWCDAAGDRRYNRLVRHPYPASAERLWRQDQLYDIVVVLDHNRRPRLRGRGSAIFIHVARDGFGPTEGCVALRAGDLRRLLARIGPRGGRLLIR